MAEMLKITAAWSGFVGSPGYSNFYFNGPGDGFWSTDNSDACADKVEAFFSGVAGLLPPAVRVSVKGEAEIVDPVDGRLIGFHSTGSRGTVMGSAQASGYSAASGVVVTWRTNGVVANRRARGRTFLVPAANTAYDLDGTLQSNTVNTLQTAANALLAPFTEISLGVWARPHEARVNKAGTVIPARTGSWHAVTSASIPDKTAVLRSRRD